MNQRILSLLAAALLGLATLPNASAACERRYPEENGDDRTRHVRLSAAWPDAQILQNLKLNIDRADVKRTQGTGVLTVQYAYFHKTVIIQRAAASGVEVQLVEKDRDKLVWKLGNCQP